jgi:phasin family protein
MAKAKSSAKSAKSSAKSFNESYTNGKNGFESAAKSFENFFNAKGMEEATAYSKQNLDAVLETSNLLAQGCQEISNAWMGFAQQSLQTSVNAAKELMGCKSLQEAMELQTTYARSFFEDAVNEGSRLSEMSARVANEAFEPVRGTINTAMEKVFKAA